MDFKIFIEKSHKLRNDVDELYIYGAGLFGREIFAILKRNNVSIDGFLETDCKESREVWGVKVYALDSVINKNEGIIIAMNIDNTIDARKNLKVRHFPSERILNGGGYLAEDKISHLLADNPELEINTVIGCPVNCKYCTQDVFISKYFEKDKNRQRWMTLENFVAVLSNTPDDCIINFAALSEPFVNHDCVAMIKMACDVGRTVLLFSTFVGATDEEIDEVLELPIHAITLHCADSKGYAKIPTDGNYYGRMEKILNASKPDGTPMVVGVSAQTEPTKEMVELCKGKHEIKYSLHDRVGYLKDSRLASVKTPHKGRFLCSRCGPKLNSHMVCPDGTVVLCNNDFGMNFNLGNIYNQTFDEIQESTVLKTVLRGMNGDDSLELICMKCVCTRVL